MSKFSYKSRKQVIGLSILIKSFNPPLSKPQHMELQCIHNLKLGTSFLVVELWNKLITFWKESDLLHNLLSARNRICVTFIAIYFPRNKCFPQFPRAPELEMANISLRKARVRQILPTSATCIGLVTFPLKKEQTHNFPVQRDAREYWTQQDQCLPCKLDFRCNQNFQLQIANFKESFFLQTLQCIVLCCP